jgi:hypothetical protein
MGQGRQGKCRQKEKGRRREVHPPTQEDSNLKPATHGNSCVKKEKESTLFLVRCISRNWGCWLS